MLMRSATLADLPERVYDGRVKRAGGWILGLLVIGAKGGGGWFALRRSLQRETVWVTMVAADDGRGPTSGALYRGAEFALKEMDGRVGRYRITLDLIEPQA